MTEAQAEEIIALLELIHPLMVHAVFLLHAIGLGVGFIFGLMTWNLIVQGKNEKGMW
ncbi:MAG: hypothetical protein WD151_15135 [Phycisphaeraceae bacterium]